MDVSKQPVETPATSEYQAILRSHMPELDAIRGLAILGVILYHGFYWARDLSLYTPWQRQFLTLMAPGQFGVNLFFILSGFLITGILLESKDRPDYYSRFYFRRALRILPAYYLTLVLLVLFGITSHGFLVMSLLYSSNMSPLFGIAISYSVLWSLAVEEHFYLVWPSALRRISPAKLLWVLGAMLIASPVSRFLYYEQAVRTQMVGPGYGSFTWNHLDGLALGAIVAIVVRRPGWKRKQLLQLSIILTASAILLAIVGYPFGILTRRTAIGQALQYVPWNFAFAGLLGTFLLIGSGRWRRFVAPSFLIFFGQISYGLYLYHLMVFMGYDWAARRIDLQSLLNLSPWEGVWARVFIAGTAAIVAAYLSRRFFEEPFLRLKNRFPGRYKEVEAERDCQGTTVVEWAPADTNGESPEKFPTA